MYTAIYVPVCNHLYLYQVKHEFILMSPTGLHYHMDYSSLLSLPICKLPFLQWKTWLPSFSIHFLNCSILVNIYKVSELLIHPRGIILAVRVCTYVQFLFTIKLDSTCFQSYIDQLLFLWFFFFFKFGYWKSLCTVYDFDE